MHRGVGPKNLDKDPTEVRNRASRFKSATILRRSFVIPINNSRFIIHNMFVRSLFSAYTSSLRMETWAIMAYMRNTVSLQNMFVMNWWRNTRILNELIRRKLRMLIRLIPIVKTIEVPMSFTRWRLRRMNRRLILKIREQYVIVETNLRHRCSKLWSWVSWIRPKYGEDSWVTVWTWSMVSQIVNIRIVMNVRWITANGKLRRVSVSLAEHRCCCTLQFSCSRSVTSRYSILVHVIQSDDIDAR